MSWISGARVEKKPLRQWFLRASQFSKDLYDGLDDPTLQNWRDIIKIQKNWIGEPNGTNIDFKMAEDQNDVLTAWTDMPEFINEVAFIGVSSGHLLDRKELVVSRKFNNFLNNSTLTLIKGSF